MATRNSPYVDEVARAVKQTLSKIDPSIAPSKPIMLPPIANVAATAQATVTNAVGSLQTWYVSALDLTQKYASSHVFIASVCFLVLLLIFIVLNPPFVQQTVPNKHPLEDAPPSFSLACFYSALAVSFVFLWPIIERWAPIAWKVVSKYV